MFLSCKQYEKIAKAENVWIYLLNNEVLRINHYKIRKMLENCLSLFNVTIKIYQNQFKNI